MPAPDLRGLRSTLLRAGVAPRHVKRVELELGDHFRDLVDDGLASGLDRGEAETRALGALGNIESIAADICSRPELRSWAASYPRLALIVYPLACVAVLPAVPVIAGVANASHVGRWIACALMSGLVTAAILLVLQLSITMT